MYKQLTVAIMAAVMVVSGCVLLASDDSEAVSAGGNSYSTITQAIDVAPADGTSFTITLTGDVTESITISTGKNIVLDLGTYTLTNTSGNHTITVQSGATLTVQGNGTVDNVTHQKGALVNNGTTIINGGTFTRSAETGVSPDESGGNSWYVIDNQGIMTFNGGSVTSTGNFSSLIRNLGTASDTAGDLTINGGTFTNGFIVIKNDDKGVVDISGGVFTSTHSKGSSLQNWGKADVSGGTFNGTVSAWTWDDRYGNSSLSISGNAVINGNLTMDIDDNETATMPQVDVRGGSITGSIIVEDVSVLTISGGSIGGGIKVADSVEPDISITGGSFGEDVSEYVTGGYWVDNGDGTFSVSETKPIDPPSYDDELPPFIPTQPAEEDDTVTIVACAAAAAVAAILAVFLVIDRKG